MSAEVEPELLRIWRPSDFDFGCYTMRLTVKRGTGAGRTIVYCTCGWKHIYKSLKKALKREAQHLEMSK